MKLETYGNCFVCGEKNPKGLKLSFEIDKEKQTLKTTFVAEPMFQGADGTVHEGVLTVLLDEATSKLVFELGYHALTASLKVRFKKPALIFKPLFVYGKITEITKRLIRAKAYVVDQDGVCMSSDLFGHFWPRRGLHLEVGLNPRFSC